MCYLLWNKDVHFCRFSLKIGICIVEWLKSTSRDHKSTPKYTASVRVPQAFAHGWWFHWSLWHNCTYFPPFLMHGSRDLDDNLPINANNSQLLSKRCCTIRVCDENIVQLYISTYNTLIIICVKIISKMHSNYVHLNYLLLKTRFFMCFYLFLYNW
jgi:hypothetical protein